jgi:hypothetical protein
MYPRIRELKGLSFDIIYHIDTYVSKMCLNVLLNVFTSALNRSSFFVPDLLLINIYKLKKSRGSVFFDSN